MKHVGFIETDLSHWLKTFHFYDEVNVRFSETDAFGHVNNVSHFIYFEQARLAYMAQIKGFYQFLHPKSETIVVAADIHCHYVQQIFFPNRLKVWIKAAHIGKSSLDFQYALTGTDQSEIFAVARGTIVHINKKTGKSAPWHEELVNEIEIFEKR